MNKKFSRKLKQLEKRIDTQSTNNIAEIADNNKIYFNFLAAKERITNGEKDSIEFPLYVIYNKSGKHTVNYPTGEIKIMTESELTETQREICKFIEVERSEKGRRQVKSLLEKYFKNKKNRQV